MSSKKQSCTSLMVLYAQLASLSSSLAQIKDEHAVTSSLMCFSTSSMDFTLACHILVVVIIIIIIIIIVVVIFTLLYFIYMHFIYLCFMFKHACMIRCKLAELGSSSLSPIRCRNFFDLSESRTL